MEQMDHVVDLSFPIRGGTIPADHGYPLYAAISRVLPEVHGDEAVGIHPVHGQLIGGRQLALTDDSRLVIRAPASRIAGLIRCSGQRLSIGGALIAVGVPTVRPLQAAPIMLSRLVVIRGFMDADAFLDAVRRQMVKLEVGGTAGLVPHRVDGALENKRGSRAAVVRRTLRIQDKEVVGFAVRVDELSPADSLRLQVVGLGGRRRFGCGVFVPIGEDRP